MRLTGWATSVGLALTLGCSSGGGGTTVIDSGITPPTDMPGGTDRPVVPTDGPACAATTCGTCTPMGSCGWCARTNRCMAGGGTGSSDMSCTGADWQYLPSQCGGDGGVTPPVDATALCAMGTACGGCTAMGPCGWCLTTNRCMQGGSAGSADMTCMGATNWTFTSRGCPGFDGGTSCRGIPRDCGLTIAGGVRTCTAGSMVTIGCNSQCSPALGSCTGDAVMQICPGTATTTVCSGMAVIASNDDAPTSAMCDGDGAADLCPVTTFMCPANGMYTVWTGAYSGDSMATCVPAVR